MKYQSQINFNQYLKLIYIIHYKKSYVIYLTIIGVIMVITSFLFYAGITPTLYKEGPVFQLAFGLFVVFGFPIFIYFSSKKNFSSSQRIGERIQYEFSEENLKMEGESFKAEYSWEKTHKIEELADWFLIYQNERVGNLIPKNGMTIEQIAYLRDVFSRLATSKVKLKKLKSLALK